MNTVSISLEDLIKPLLGLSIDNRRWIAERLIQPQKPAATVAETAFDEADPASWMSIGFSKQDANDLAEAVIDTRNGKFAFSGTAQEAIEWMESL